VKVQNVYVLHQIKLGHGYILRCTTYPVFFVLNA